MYLFYDGPASNPFNSARFSFYGVGSTPTVKIDGQNASSSPSTYAAAIDNRLAVPSDVVIDVSITGNASGGSALVTVTAEQAPPSGTIKVYCAITEDHEIAGSAWGGYSGKEMMWIPVAFPLGYQGTVVDFTGPYPQTLTVSGNYTLDPSSDIFDNLNVVTFVQETSSREVLNASFMDLPDTASGIYEGSTESAQNPTVSVWPNPTTGAFTVASVLPDGGAATIEVFDVTGRLVLSSDAPAIVDMRLDEAGVYFVKLTTGSGGIATSRLAVVR